MKNKPAPKKLQRCPLCRVGGFVNLKAHRCKGAPSPAEVITAELEIVEPADLKAIGACVKQLRKLQGSIQTKSRDLIYDIVGAGVYFLKLQGLHRSDHLTQFKALGDGSETVSPPEEPQGFHAVVEAEFCRADIEDEGERGKHVKAVLRTAQNYMNAARNAGLDGDATMADVQRLRKQKALDDRNATELYRLKQTTTPDEPANEEPQPKWNLVRDTLCDLREQCEAAVNLRGDMSKKAYSTACARLQRTLEDLTQTAWVMTKVRKPGESLHFQEHGDVYELGN